MFEYNDLSYLKEKLKTDLEKGLSNNEVIRRQKLNGKNILEGKKKDSVFKIFFNQLKDPMIYILLVAIIISFFLKEYSDAIVVVVVVLLNAAIGAFQEIKTEKALEVLKKMSTHKCRVVREGNELEVETSELVIGDLVCLENGNSVGADIRLTQVNNLRMDESSITGESNPVEKNNDTLSVSVKNLGDKKNMVYMSTLVIGGAGKGIVTSIGMNTEIGKIAKMIKEEEVQKTPLQKRLFDLGKLLGILTVVICFVMFIISLFEKRNILDMLVSSISLAVAAIPEGLPAVVTIVLAIGVQRMIKVNALVKKLPSVETLGAVSVVCTDKTGTLTENKLKCVGIFQNGKYVENTVLNQNEMILNMILCNNAVKSEEEYIGSPMEIALLNLVDANKVSIINYERLEEKEFDSNRKIMSTLNLINGKKIQFTKGAYDRIISKCKYIKIGDKNELLTEKIILNINREIDNQAEKARRILAFSYVENCSSIREMDMIFLGFVVFMDPPRKGVKEAIETFRKAGVRTIMITGDYIKTACAIGKELGIVLGENDCISGEQLDMLNDKQLEDIVESKNVFARVTPTHKAKIVGALKSKNNIVAMTGDGVNDAPSLKKADIGIAMGINGSDVAKEASEMILADDNFTTIKVAIEEGRTIYNNIKKSVLFLLSSNFAEIIVMSISILLGLPLPLAAIHILIVNLLTDSIPALALGADNKDDDIMNNPPRKSEETLFSNKGLFNTIFYGLIIAFLTMVAFFIPAVSECMKLGVNVNLDNVKSILLEDKILSFSQTYSFVVLSLTELFYSISCRNPKKGIFRKDIMSNKYLNLSIIGGVILTGVMVGIAPLRNFLKLSPIDIVTFLMLVLYSSAIVFTHEATRNIVSRETKEKKKVHK